MEKIYATQIQTITTFNPEINLGEYEYISQENIVVVNEPNKLGRKCDYQHDAIDLQSGFS